MNFCFTRDLEPGSTYALIEPMEGHTTASFDKTIPRVKPFKNNTRGYVLVNVAQLDGSVGLLTELKHVSEEGRRGRGRRGRREATTTKSSHRYVIRPGRAFKKDIAAASGNIKNLYLNKTR